MAATPSPACPDAVKGLEKLELLVVADPHPTTFASMSATRKDNTYLLPIGTSFEMDGLAHRLEPLAAMGRADRRSRSSSRRTTTRSCISSRKKLGFADRMFKNIKVENNVPDAEDILREINRGGWSTGYCGQSPERLKAHMRNQDKFDLVTLRAPKDDPEVGGDYYGLPWPCWGKPEIRHPGTHDPLQHEPAREGRRRHVPRPLRRRAQRRRRCSPEGSYSRGLGAHRRLSRIHHGRCSRSSAGTRT